MALAQKNKLLVACNILNLMAEFGMPGLATPSIREDPSARGSSAPFGASASTTS